MEEWEEEAQNRGPGLGREVVRGSAASMSWAHRQPQQQQPEDDDDDDTAGHCTTMDYSSAIANEGGASPWASSPQHDRSVFPNSNNHDVPSTASLSHQPPAPEGQDFHQHDNSNNQYPSQQPQPQAYDNATRSEPQRYHHARPQHQPPQHPHQQHQNQQQPQQPRKQYKLQAKITALERTGRKDPVLRFDVYVCCCLLRTAASKPTNLLDRRTSQSSVLPNSAMSAAPTPSSSSLPTTSFHPILMLSYPLSLHRSLPPASVPRKMRYASRLQCSAG